MQKRHYSKRSLKQLRVFKQTHYKMSYYLSIIHCSWVSGRVMCVLHHFQQYTNDIFQLNHIHVNLPAGAFFSRFWGSLPSTFKIFCPWKKSSTIKSWPTFCNQYFWKFPIWNSCADEKRWEIRMVKECPYLMISGYWSVWHLYR